MNQTRKILQAPYGKDNDLNCFGDFSTLELVLAREKEDDLVTEVWSLVGPPHVGRQELTPYQVNTACQNLFFASAIEVHPHG